MIRFSSSPTSNLGFTAVEMLVTIVVAAIFATSFYMLFTTVNSASASARSNATASDLAYSYLRKYASASSTPTWFVCSTASGSSNTNDSVINSNATGQVLENITMTTAESNLPSPIVVKVTALATYGCNGDNVKKPIRIESQVTYGPQSTVVDHVTYVGY